MLLYDKGSDDSVGTREFMPLLSMKGKSRVLILLQVTGTTGTACVAEKGLEGEALLTELAPFSVVVESHRTTAGLGGGDTDIEDTDTEDTDDRDLVA